MPALFQLERNLRHSTLQQQIRVQLVDAILGGYIPLDEPLPSSRGLAKSLKVARNTIVLVYDELAADGYLSAKSEVVTTLIHNLSQKKYRQPNQN